MDIEQALQDGLAKVVGWVEALIQNIPEIISAVVIVVVFSFLARTVRNVVKRLDRATDHGPVKSLMGQMAWAGTRVLDEPLQAYGRTA